MMEIRVGLIDSDGHRYPNLALMKLARYHREKGDEVSWVNTLEKYDLVYIVKVFTFSPEFSYYINAKEIVRGGTGYNLTSELPAEVESIFPDYSLYPEHTQNKAFGFLTRGCPRRCPFCIVSQKEGCFSMKVADITSFWNGQKNIELLDPNILASRDRIELLEQLTETKAQINFSQGLDIRLMNEEIIEKLKEVKIKMLHFAFDDMKDEAIILRNLKSFKAETNLNYRKLRVYVLTNYNTSFEEDLYRVQKLKEEGYDPYIMVYNKGSAPQLSIELQRYVNAKQIFRSINSFEEYKKTFVYEKGNNKKLF